MNNKSWKKLSQRMLKEVKDMPEKDNIDQQILKVQNSTKTTIGLFCPIHNKLRMKYYWYYKWHLNPWAGKVHAVVLAFLIVGFSAGFLGILGSNSKPVQAAPNTVDTSTSAYASAAGSSSAYHDYQRRTFHDGTNYWSFYYNGSAIEYSYSSDGASWTSAGTIAVNAPYFSVWNNGTAVYVTYISTGVKARSGTISGTTLSFGAEATVSSNALAMSSYISQDTSNFLWVTYATEDFTSEVYAVKSSSASDITAWGTATSLYSSDMVNTPKSPTIVPLTSGDMYATWSQDNGSGGWTPYGKKYTSATTSWGSAASLVSDLAAGTYYATIAADASANVHAVIVNGSSTKTWYKKYASGSWGTAIELDSNTGNYYPTLSVNSSNGDLYAFWGRANAIYYKKGVSPYASGNWDVSATSLYSTGSNKYLAASYNTTSTKVFLQWTNGTANPYSVYFDNSVAASVACTYTSTQSGNWSATSTWVGGCVPGDGNNTTIAAGHTVTVDSTQNIGTGTLTVNGTLNQSAALTAGDTTISSTGTLSTGNNALNVGAMTVNASGNLTGGTGNTITASGNWTGSGTFTPNTSTVKMTGTGKTITSTNSLYNLRVDGGSTTVSANIGVTNAVLVTNGATFNLDGKTLAMGASLTLDSGTTWTKGTNGIIQPTYSATASITDSNSTPQDLGDLYSDTDDITINFLSNVKLESMKFSVFSGPTVDMTNRTVTLTGTNDLSAPITDENGAGTFTFTGSTIVLATSGSYNMNGFSFNNLEIQNGTYVAQSANAVAGNFTLTSGTYNCNSQNLSVGGNFSLASGATFTKGGTLTFNGTSQTFTDSTASTQDLGTVTIGPSTTTAVSTASAMKATTLTVGANDTLDISSDTLTLAGAGTPLTITAGGTFTTTGSTVAYSTTLATNVAAAAYNNLTLEVGNSDVTYSLAGTTSAAGNLAFSFQGIGTVGLAITDKTLAVTGNVAIDAGATISMTSGTLQVGGNYSNSGTLTPGTGTVEFTKSSGTQTLTSGGTTAGTKAFNNITHSGAGTLQLATNNLKASGSLNNSGGTLDANDLTVEVTGTLTVASGTTYQTGTNTNTIGTLSNSGTTAVENTGLASSKLAITTFTNNSGSLVKYVSASATTVKDGTYYNLELDNASTTFALNGTTTVDNNLTLTNGTLNTNNQSVNLAGNLSLALGTTFTKGTGTLTMSGTSKTITDSTASLQDLGAVTVSGSVSLSSDAKLSSLTVNNTKSLDITNRTVTITGTGTPLTNNGTLTATGSTVVYTGTTTDTNIGVAPYNNLTLTPTGATTYTLAGNLTSSNAMTGNLTINSGATLSTSASNYSVDISGNWTDNGSFTANSGTVDFKKSSGTQTVTAETFGNLTHSGAGTLQLQSAITVNGNLTNSAGTLDANGQNISLSGNWANTATFSAGTTPGNQTVTFQNDGTAVVSGTTTFNKLTLNSSGSTSGKTINFASGTTQTISSTLTLTGASGKVLTLGRSGGTGTNQWTLAIAASFISGSYIAVSNSNVTGGTITPGSYSSVTDGGNNSGWDFDTDYPTVDITSSPASANGSNGWFKTTAPTVSITASESESGVASISYRWGSTGDYTTASGASVSGITAPEGTNTLYVYATDNIGNGGSSSPSSQEYKVDTVAPTIDIAASPSSANGSNSYYKTTAPSITLSGTDVSSSTATIYYKWDSGSYAAYSSALTPAEGTHTISYYGIDNAGNQSTAAEREYKVDTNAPTVSITSDSSAPNGPTGTGYYTSAPTITLSSSDSVSGLSLIKYRWGTAGEYATYSTALTAPENTNTLYYYAEDNAGNTGEANPSSSTYQVDLTAPSFESSNVPAPAATPTNKLETSFSWTAPSDGTGSGISHYLVTIGSTSTGSDILHSQYSASNSYTHTFAKPGTYYIRVKAVDKVQRISSFSAEGSVVIDQTSPLLEITNLVDNQYIKDKTITLAGSSSDVITNVSKVQLKIDDGQWTDTTSSDSYKTWGYDWKDYAEGRHTILAKAIDLAGNEKTSTTFTVVVDTIAPSVPSDLRVFNVSNQTASVYSTYLDLAGSSDEVSGVKGYEVYKNGTKIADIKTDKDAANGSFTGNENQSYFYYDSGLTSGKYAYKIRAIDKAENTSETAEVSIETSSQTVETDAISEFKVTPSSAVSADKTSAIASWKTTYPATSQVEYGQTTSYGQKTDIDTNVNQGHNILLPNLKPNTTYHAKVTSRDIYGREMQSGDTSFTTRAVPEQKNAIQTIITVFQNIFKTLTVQGAAADITTNPEELKKLQDFSNNLLVTDVSFKEKNFYQNVLTFPKGSKISKGTTDKNYSGLSTADDYLIDKDVIPTNTYYYRLDEGMAVVRKPVVGDDSALSVIEPEVVKESVFVTQDKVQLTLSWKTNRGSSSQVEFGNSASYGQKSKEYTSLNMGHNIILEDLTPDTTYHFKVTSKDSKGSVAASNDFTFQTPVLPKQKTPLDIIVETLQRVFGSLGL